MSHEHHHHQHEIDEKPKRAPLWKWIIVIALIIAMPLFFAFVRSLQTQQAISVSDQK